jgi:hypothetical protein
MSLWNAGLLQTAVRVAVPFLLVSCQSKTQDPPATESNRAKAATAEQAASVEEQRKANDWRRMKECADQADRFIKQPDPLRNQLAGWENHYSPKYGRCYVAISYLNGDAKKNPKVPLMFDVLYDAFEGRSLAMCADQNLWPRSFLCTVQEGAGPKFDCHTCRQYIDDHMRN